MKNAAKVSLIIFSVLLIVVGMAVGVFFLLIEPKVNILNSPNLNEAQLASYTRTVKILDKDDNILDDVLYDNGKYYVALDELAPYTSQAFVAVEDKRFYEHRGIDYKRMASALVSNIKARKFNEGASTITQQLIKNTHLSNEKTIKRKLNEMRLARQLERIYSKDQILESYLNILYFGSGIHGIGTASRVMFNRPASELTLAQSAALAAIINNPTKYNPYTNIDNLNARKTTVLKRMLDQNYITADEYDEACAEKLEFSKNKQTQFVSGLLKSACSALGCSEKELFARNYTLKTSYDSRLSDCVREIVCNKDFNGFMRVLVLDNETGGIACDETNTYEFIDPYRSPASCIKPFMSYAPALESGLNPLSQILDEPTDFDGYTPKNYRNSYRGYQSLTECLSRSSNIAAVKLVYDIGIDKCKTTAKSFGIELTDVDGLSAALGGIDKGVRLSELTNAYRTLANGGLYTNCDYLMSVSANIGGTVYSMPKNERQVVGDDTAYLLTDMLKTCASVGTAKKLARSGIIAAKTGTNGDENGNRDCYCVAYTPKYTVAVWFGSNEELIGNNITGASCCEIIQEMVSRGVLDTSVDFDMPQSVAYYEIDDYELRNSHEVYLANPLLPKRYCRRALLSKKHLPIQKSVDIIDYFDSYFWENNIYGFEMPIFE